MCTVKENIDINICAFADDCPVIKTSNKCPFNQFASMSMEEIIEYLNNEKSNKAGMLMDHYRQCKHAQNYFEKKV